MGLPLPICCTYPRLGGNSGKQQTNLVLNLHLLSTANPYSELYRNLRTISLPTALQFNYSTTKMPLQVTSETPSEVEAFLTSSATPSKPSFLVVYASLDPSGKSWCGDCRVAESFVNRKFADRELDVVRVVYAGQRDEAPFSITNLPTLVKVTDGKWEKLVEADVYDQKKLDAFVGDL
ncbi:uncharacterized protein L3040_006700 [Drepanopeziza brunnea f. sp. 'multigermtubi']|uniref:uncharacterized protein n=1 Tax=Drepanopeziza brunnea f. sp. 'multigermtubi' TaxID=698441 RepID=UPI0023882F0E|nr:hypothetical protein L3040_006700 [Drepanopeziza brunnea f. sp. 'multigermtubi']